VKRGKGEEQAGQREEEDGRCREEKNVKKEEKNGLEGSVDDVDASMIFSSLPASLAHSACSALLLLDSTGSTRPSRRILRCF
jgi:hypothetical protein